MASSFSLAKTLAKPSLRDLRERPLRLSFHNDIIDKLSDMHDGRLQVAERPAADGAILEGDRLYPVRFVEAVEKDRVFMTPRDIFQRNVVDVPGRTGSVFRAVGDIQLE